MFIAQKLRTSVDFNKTVRFNTTLTDLVNKNQLEEALAHCEKVLGDANNQPEFNVQVKFRYAKLLFSIKKMEECREQCTKILEEKINVPDQIGSDCCQLLAKIFSVFHKDIRSAEKYFISAMEYTPRDPQLICRYASFLHNYFTSRQSQVDKLFRQAMIIQPRNIIIIRAYSTFLLDNRRPKDAIKICGGLLRTVPRIPGAFVNFASLLCTPRFRHFDKAIAHCKTALKSDPDNVEAYVLLGRIHANSLINRYEDAKKYFSKAIEIDKNHPHVYFFYGVLLEQQFEETEKSGELFKKYYDINLNKFWTREEILIYCHEAQYLHKKHRSEEAVYYITRANEMHDFMKFDIPYCQKLYHKIHLEDLAPSEAESQSQNYYSGGFDTDSVHSTDSFQMQIISNMSNHQPSYRRAGSAMSHASYGSLAENEVMIIPNHSGGLSDSSHISRWSMYE